MELYDQFLRVINRGRDPVVLRLEPWAEEHEMPSGATFLIVARGPRDDCLTLDVADDGFEVWAWFGSEVWLFHDGEQLISEHSNRSSSLAEPPKLRRIDGTLR